MGQLQPYSQTPYDSNLSPESNNFQRWLQTSINSLIGVLYPLPSPTVSTVGFAGAVQVKWNEVVHAGYYLIFETDDQNAPTDDIPVGTVPANRGGPQNSFLRSGIADDTTRYYWVQPFSPSGVPGKIGGGVAGTATSFIPTGLSGSLIEIGIDSALQQVREDFISGGIAAATVGAFGLSAVTVGTATASFQAGTYPFLGIFRLAPASGFNRQVLVAYNTTADPQVAPFGPLNNLSLGAHVKMQWIALMGGGITDVAVRLGFLPCYTGASNNGERTFDPPDGIFFRFDTNAQGYADSTWKAVVRRRISGITTISCTSNVVTVQTSAVHGLVPGNLATISGLQADGTFCGDFIVQTTADTTHFTYNLTHANATPAATSSSFSRSTVIDTGVVPITSGYLRFEIESSAPGVFVFRISNGTSVSQDKTIDAGLGHWLPTTGLSLMAAIGHRNTGVTRTLDLDYLGIGFNSLIQPDPTKARWF